MRAYKESDDLLKIMKDDKSDLEKMKDERWKEYQIEDYSEIESLLRSGDYFLGIREDYVNIYYKGMSMAKIETYYNRVCKYSLSRYYVETIPGYERKSDEEAKKYKAG